MQHGETILLFFFLDDILFQSQEILERLFAYSILEIWRGSHFSRYHQLQCMFYF